jgi:hypothetical protein
MVVNHSIFLLDIAVPDMDEGTSKQHACEVKDAKGSRASDFNLRSSIDMKIL